MGISKYLPKREHILPVYALLVLGFYGWSIYWFIWNLPSWLSFMRLNDILGVLAYVFVVNLLEALVMTALLIVLGILLPARWVREDFVLRAGLTAICFVDCSIFSMDAKDSPANGRLSTISISMRRDRYKLIYYTGYKAYRGYPDDPSYNKGAFELYDLEADPEELHDIAGDAASVFKPMKDELLDTYNKYGNKVI